jgi:hypothetical protein
MFMPGRHVDFSSMYGKKIDSDASNMILPATVVDHFTVGFDLSVSNHWSTGGHIMSAPEESLMAANTDPQAPGVEICLGETSMDINLGYRF